MIIVILLILIVAALINPRIAVALIAGGLALFVGFWILTITVVLLISGWAYIAPILLIGFVSLVIVGLFQKHVEIVE